MFPGAAGAPGRSRRPGTRRVSPFDGGVHDHFLEASPRGGGGDAAGGRRGATHVSPAAAGEMAEGQRGSTTAEPVAPLPSPNPLPPRGRGAWLTRPQAQREQAMSPPRRRRRRSPPMTGRRGGNPCLPRGSGGDGRGPGGNPNSRNLSRLCPPPNPLPPPWEGAWLTRPQAQREQAMSPPRRGGGDAALAFLYGLPRGPAGEMAEGQRGQHNSQTCRTFVVARGHVTTESPTGCPRPCHAPRPHPGRGIALVGPPPPGTRLLLPSAAPRRALHHRLRLRSGATRCRDRRRFPHRP